MSELSGWRGRVRKFDPGAFQPDEELIGQYAVRKHEFSIVLEVLRGNVGAPSCQHILLAAPRGHGKTMLLARVAAELRIHRELSEWLLPVRFMEESQEIFNLGDFWLETLFHLQGRSARPILKLHKSSGIRTRIWRPGGVGRIWKVTLARLP